MRGERKMMILDKFPSIIELTKGGMRLKNQKIEMKNKFRAVGASQPWAGLAFEV